MLSSVDTIGAFNTGIITVNLHRPAAAGRTRCLPSPRPSPPPPPPPPQLPTSRARHTPSNLILALHTASVPLHTSVLKSTH